MNIIFEKIRAEIKSAKNTAPDIKPGRRKDTGPQSAPMPDKNLSECIWDDLRHANIWLSYI